MIVEAPGLDVVLRELGVGEQLDGVWYQLHIALGKLLQLQLHQADLVHYVKKRKERKDRTCVSKG